MFPSPRRGWCAAARVLPICLPTYVSVWPWRAVDDGSASTVGENLASAHASRARQEAPPASKVWAVGYLNSSSGSLRRDGDSPPRPGKTAALPDSRLVSLGIGGYEGIFYDKPDCAAYVRRPSH